MAKARKPKAALAREVTVTWESEKASPFCTNHTQVCYDAYSVANEAEFAQQATLRLLLSRKSSSDGRQNNE